MDKTKIKIQVEENLEPIEFIDILTKSGLYVRRPINDNSKIRKMCMNANLIITARYEGEIIGIARSLTDFAFCTYLSDLAVDKNFQALGIGNRLILETRKRSNNVMLILLAAPGVSSYYQKIGMEKFTEAFIIK